ncbi:histidine phosphatase family protein [Nocardioides bruguierae]|nr:histidine phosphatase family protein [Nocardioides bruguierae]
MSIEHHAPFAAPLPHRHDPELPEMWVVRHGATEWSKNGRHTSTTDLPLLPEGEDGARALRQRLAEVEFAEVWASPRQRARTTAALAGFGEPEVVDDLQEWDYGDYEGLTRAQVHEEHDPTWAVWTHGCPGGESPRDVAARLDRVVERARAARGPVLAFAHGHSLRVLAVRWLDLPVAEGRHFHLDTTTVSILGTDRGLREVRRWNA